MLLLVLGGFDIWWEGLEVLEDSWSVRDLGRTQAISDEAFEVLGEVSGNELDLSCQLNVLLVEVVAVESLQSINVWLGAY